MELVADICQLSLSDLYELAIAYVELIDVGGGYACDEDIVTNTFGGKQVGWKVLEVIDMQRSEIMAYIPDTVLEMHYLRCHRDGVYVYARTSDDVNDGQSNLLPGV